MIHIQATSDSAAEVFWNGYRVFMPSQSAQSNVRGAVVAIEHSEGITYIYRDGSVSQWNRATNAPVWSDDLVTAALNQLGAIQAAFDEAAAVTARGHRAFLNSMSPSRRAAWLAEYGAGSVDEG